MRADDAMTRNVTFIEPTDDLLLAHALMEGLGIRHLPVVEKGRLVGILSDRDIRAFSTVKNGSLTVPEIPASEAMTRDLITCPPAATISTVGEKMLLSKVDSIPIVGADGALVGLVTSSDMIRLLIDREESVSAEIPFEFTLVEGRRTRLEATARS